MINYTALFMPSFETSWGQCAWGHRGSDTDILVLQLVSAQATHRKILLNYPRKKSLQLVKLREEKMVKETGVTGGWSMGGDTWAMGQSCFKHLGARKVGSLTDQHHQGPSLISLN